MAGEVGAVPDPGRPSGGMGPPGNNPDGSVGGRPALPGYRAPRSLHGRAANELDDADQEYDLAHLYETRSNVGWPARVPALEIDRESRPDRPRGEPPGPRAGEIGIEQLQLACEQGRALENALDHRLKQQAGDVGEQCAGDYLVSYAIEPAEGVYVLRGNELYWKEPEGDNVRLELAVRDAVDGRFIPGLEVYATLVDGTGQEIGTQRQAFVWHPWLYHYGRNWCVPGGEYTLRVYIEVPDFHRHGRVNGRRFTRPTEVTFTGVRIEIG